MNVSLPQLLQILGSAHVKIALLEEQIEQLKRELEKVQAKKKE